MEMFVRPLSSCKEREKNKELFFIPSLLQPLQEKKNISCSYCRFSLYLSSSPLRSHQENELQSEHFLFLACIIKLYKFCFYSLACKREAK